MFHEMWHYTRRSGTYTWVQNIGNHTVTHRYVPPGFVKRSFYSSLPQPAVSKPLKFALLATKESSYRNDCVRLLRSQPIFKHSLSWRYDVFADTAWVKFMRDNPGIVFLNLHRMGGDPEQNPLELFRIAPYLSMGALVISEETKPLDQKELQNMVYFVPDLCRRNLTASVTRTIQSHDLLEQIRAQFAQRFQTRQKPLDIMKRAGVWRLRGELAR